jgi:hypothetical protein
MTVVWNIGVCAFEAADHTVVDLVGSPPSDGTCGHSLLAAGSARTERLH